MTEFPDADGGQIACEVTGLTTVAGEVVAAWPEQVWDLAADVTRVGGCSPECIRTAWLGQSGRPQSGARFTGHHRFPDGFEYELTCVVTEADRLCVFAWVVLDDSTIAPWVLFPGILAAVAVLAYLGIRISSLADMLLVAGRWR